MACSGDDHQLRTSNSIMEALRIGQRNTNILVSDHNQRWDTNLADLVAYSFPSKNPPRSAENANAVVAAHPSSPPTPQLGARRVIEELLAEQNRHHPVHHHAWTKPADDNTHQPELRYTLTRL